MLADGPPPPLLVERMDIGVPEIFASIADVAGGAGHPPDPVTDKLVAKIAATQAADGSWHGQNGAGDRPPAEEGFITRTALCIRSLKVYGPPGRAAEMNARVSRARRWLAAATPVTAEERNMRLLGLMWSGADAATLKPLAATILARSSLTAAGVRSTRWRAMPTPPASRCTRSPRRAASPPAIRHIRRA